MTIIDGKAIALELRAALKKRVAIIGAHGVVPGLATILVGADPASQVYVNSKIKICGELGIQSFHHPLPADATQTDIIRLIERLNGDGRVHGILLQLPLPGGMDPEKCLSAIDPAKDADGLTPGSLGRLFGIKSFSEIEKNGLLVPCTPLGVMHLLSSAGIEVFGKRAVVVGRSNLVGKPVAIMLMAANATVTVAHSRTQDLPALCREADILVAAIGRAGFVTRDLVKPGAAVIDVGINRTDQGLRGDVDFDSVRSVAGYLTPVPGGVGPMTIAMLMRNTVAAAAKAAGA